MVGLLFAAAEFHAADLAGNRLGQVGEFNAADALIRRQGGTDVAEDLQRQIA
jgi:hypothetical protein